MRYWLNINHVQFDLLLGGSVEQIIGKLVHCDETGCTIIKEDDSVVHSYSLAVVQHATLAP